MEPLLRPIGIDLLITAAVLIAWSGLGGWLPRRLAALRSLDLLLRGSVGLAMAVILLAGAAAIGLPGRGWLLLAGGLAGWLRWWLRRPPARGRLALGLAVPATAAVVAVGLSALAVIRPLPSGFDPSFHVLLIEQARQTGGIVTTWEPYEDVPVHYPFGMHQLAATICQVGGGEAVAVFRALQVWLGVWQAALVVALAARWWRRPTAAWLAGGIYLLLAYNGTPWAYTGWGGLPTVLAMGLFLVVLILYLQRLTPYSAVAVGICLAALILSHHLAALIVAAVLAVNLGVCLLRRDRHALRWWLMAVGAQLLLASPYIVWYSGHLAAMGHTSTLSFADEPRFDLLAVGATLGWGLIVAAALGAWGLRQRGRSYRRRSLLVIWLATPAVAFVALDWGYRAWRLQHDGQDVTAFTPSRFLAQLVYPLTLVAAGGLAALLASLPRRAVVAAAAVLLVAGPAWHLRQVRPEIPTWYAHIPVYRWVARELPEQSLVLYNWPADRQETNWRPYLSRHPALITPLPASEPALDPRVQQKSPYIYSGDVRDLQPWLERRDLALFVVTPRGLVPTAPGWRRHSQFADYWVYEYRWQHAAAPTEPAQ